MALGDPVEAWARTLELRVAAHVTNLDLIRTIVGAVAMFDDLDTRGGTYSDGTTINDDVLVYSSSSKLVVTYRDIQHYSGTGTKNTFQFVLTPDGTIKISYSNVDDVSTGSLAGITPGAISTSTAAH